MKIQIDSNRRAALVPGDVININLNPTAGHETQKWRPCIVISEGGLNQLSTTVQVVPLTSGSGAIMRLFPKLETHQNNCNVYGTAIVTQMRAVDPVARQAELIGQVTDQDFMDALRLRIAACFGITIELLDPQ
ncbi:type II toxin-antitoxin system PemK/MazF family toxin [Pseudomonas sp. NPDC007930]|uniref:type II toxin-antitoxin system PemK/MazF family toxin n=1 Tax=Pseudomonas sp. NPDC007930 TaxID=3364417 RepID=UPI0036E670B5